MKVTQEMRSRIHIEDWHADNQYERLISYVVPGQLLADAAQSATGAEAKNFDCLLYESEHPVMLKIEDFKVVFYVGICHLTIVERANKPKNKQMCCTMKAWILHPIQKFGVYIFVFQLLLENPRHQISYIHMEHDLEPSCLAYLSAFPDLRHLVIYGIIKGKDLIRWPNLWTLST